MKNRRTLAVCGVFFAVMALLTFFSRTVYRGLLPNVETAAPTSGALRFEYATPAYTLASDGAAPLCLGVQPPSDLAIERIWVEPNQQVAAGQALARFYGPSAQLALEQAERARDEASVQVTVLQAQYQNALWEASQKLENAVSEGESLQASSQLSLLQEGIVGERSLRLAYQAYVQAENTAKALTGLAQDDWTLRAPQAGITGPILVKEGDAYDGMKPILYLIGQGEAPAIQVEWKDFPEKYSTLWTATAVLYDEYGKQACNITRFRRTDANTAEISLVPQMDCSYHTISQIAIALESPYLPLLVPNAALQESECYLLKERTGAWGQREYYAKKTALTLGASDGAYTEVTDGLSLQDILILSANTAIQDGQTVVIRQP